jgi:hypothetical protein
MATATSTDAPTAEHIERTSKIVNLASGFGGTEPRAPSAVNKRIASSTPKRDDQSRQCEDLAFATTPVHSTPDPASYYPAWGRRSKKLASDEIYVNTALLLFIQAMTVEGNLAASSG